MKFKRYQVILFVFLLIFLPIYDVLIAEEINSSLDNFQQISENEELELYINKDSTEIAIRSKNTGTIWYSNPQNIGKDESIARGNRKKRLSSQLSITYYVSSRETSGDRVREMNNFADSIEYNQYEISEIENGVRIDYILGRQWSEEDYLPQIITASMLEEKILSRLENESDKELFLNSYHLVKLEAVNDKLKHLDIFEFNSREVFGDYTITSPDENLSDSIRKELTEDLLTKFVENRSDISHKRNINVKNMEPLVELLKEEEVYVLKNRIAFWDIEDMTELLINNNYTPEETQAAHEKVGINPPEENHLIFDLAIEYRLDGKDLIVSVPVEDISYPDASYEIDDDVFSYQLTSINLLSYFDAANTSDQGYIFIPDGSGALINLNNNKLDRSSFDKPIYGPDYSINRRQELINEEQIYLPIYGMKKEDRGFLAIIEDGDAIADILADIAGRNDSYNKVSSLFNLSYIAKTSLPGQHWTFMNLYQERLYNGGISVRYKFLEDEDNNYAGMARVYQDYLIDKGVIEPLKTPERIPFLLELIGAIDRKKPVFGLPLTVSEPLTSFEDSKTILKELRENNINDIILNYRGTLKGGLDPYYPYSISFDKTLGGKKDFLKLQNYLKENDISLFTEMSVLNASDKKFKHSRDAARFINRRPAQIYTEAIDEYAYQRGIGDFRYIVSADSLDSILDNHLNDYRNYNINSISFRHLGEQLNSDYNRKNLIDRQATLDIIQGKMDMLKNNDINIVLSGVNEPFLKHVDFILDLPMDSSDYNIFDQSIPFYQMLIHGFIPYSGEAINLAKNYRYNFLKSVETGAIPYYTWIYREPSIIKKTDDYDDLQSVYYKDWLNQALSFYSSREELLLEIYNKAIVDYEELDPGVTMISYEDNINLIVNYNDSERNIKGHKIPGYNYKVLREGIE